MSVVFWFSYDFVSLIYSVCLSLSLSSFCAAGGPETDVEKALQEVADATSTKRKADSGDAAAAAPADSDAKRVKTTGATAATTSSGDGIPRGAGVDAGKIASKSLTTHKQAASFTSTGALYVSETQTHLLSS